MKLFIEFHLIYKSDFFLDWKSANALINNLNLLGLRNDKGALWENFVIVERYKYLHNHLQFANHYFWRTQQQQEIDYIEEKGGVISAYELKYSASNKFKIPKAFVSAYPGAEFSLINPENFIEFVTSN